MANCFSPRFKHCTQSFGLWILNVLSYFGISCPIWNIRNKQMSISLIKIPFDYICSLSIIGRILVNGKKSQTIYVHYLLKSSLICMPDAWLWLKGIFSEILLFIECKYIMAMSFLLFLDNHVLQPQAINASTISTGWNKTSSFCKVHI